MSFIKLTEVNNEGKEIREILIDIDNIKDCNRYKQHNCTEVIMKKVIYITHVSYYVKETLDEIQQKILTSNTIYF